MGMYDEINGEQVKCFYIPLYYYSDMEKKLTGTGVSHSCGRLRSYKNRSKLPIKTPWYKYPKNFIIADNRIDPDMYICPNCGEIYYDKIDNCEKCNKEINNECKVLGITHIIKEGRVICTCYNVDKLSENVFKDNELVVDYYGNAVGNIKSTSDLKAYFLDYSYYLKNLFKIQDKYNHYFKDYINELRGQMKGELPEDEEKIKKLSDIYNESSKEKEKEINSLRKKILSKYATEYDYRYLDVEQFGEYIICYLDIKNRINKYHKEDDIKQFTYLKEEFINFLKNNKNILNKYFLWNETSEEEKEKIQKIVNNI